MVLSLSACADSGSASSGEAGTTSTSGTTAASEPTTSGEPATSTTSAGASSPTGTAETGTSATDTSMTGTSESGVSVTGTSETGAAETGTSETGAAETGTAESGASETGTSETGTSETGGTSGMELRVLQLNLCHSGLAGCFTGDKAMVKAVAVLKSVAPTLATLNEMCRDDLPYLAAQTGAVDHRFTPALKENGTPVKCKNGDDYGIGLLSWSAPTWPKPTHGVYSTQSSNTERRVWICMGYTGFVGCTTHLSTSGPTALTQCHDLVDGPLTTAASDGPAVMAGDWNMKYKGKPNAQDCVPPGFYRKGDGSLQHVIASDDLTFIETIVIDMDGATDHPGLEVRLTLP